MATYEIEYIPEKGTSHAILLIKASTDFEAQCIAKNDYGIDFTKQCKVKKVS